MKRKLITLLAFAFIMVSFTACTKKATTPGIKSSENTSTTNNTDGKTSSKSVDIKKEDDKIIQEAMDAINDINLEEIDDSFLNDSKLDSILNENTDPMGDIPKN